MEELMSMMDDIKQQIQDNDYKKIVDKIAELKVKQHKDNLYEFVYYRQKVLEIPVKDEYSKKMNIVNKVLIKKKTKIVKLHFEGPVQQLSDVNIINQIDDGVWITCPLIFGFNVHKNQNEPIKILSIDRYESDTTYIRSLSGDGEEAMVNFREIIPISLKKLD